MRLALHGAPGAGKTTTAARLFSELKERHYSVEHVAEYVKSWAYQGRTPEGFDQVYIFGKQMQYEYRFLKYGVKNIITDSPPFLSGWYAQKYFGQEMADHIWALCDMYDKQFPVFNIFIDRGSKPYDPAGRYQTEEEAKEFDAEILRSLYDHYPANRIAIIPYDDKEAMLAKVLEVCDK